MRHALYNLATWAAQPLLRAKLRRRGRAEPGYLHAVDERFGRYGAAPARPEPAARRQVDPDADYGCRLLLNGVGHSDVLCT